MSNHANTNLARLSAEDKELIFNIRSLPDIPVIKLWTPQQKSWYEYRNREWDFIAAFIGFRQLQELGCNPSLNVNTYCDPQILDLLISKGNIYFFEFQLIIDQFDEIREFSFRDKRGFPFSNARQLFFQVLQELSNSETEDVCGNRINQGPSATQLKKGFKKLCHFWHKKLDKEELSKFINYLRSSPEWCDFWIYAVWEVYYRSSKQSKRFKYLWDVHLEALKVFDGLLSQSSKKTGVLFTTPRWSAGYAHEPKSGKQVLFDS